jgi:hypothetical protein
VADEINGNFTEGVRMTDSDLPLQSGGSSSSGDFFQDEDPQAIRFVEVNVDADAPSFRDSKHDIKMRRGVAVK